jgi:hypothetical protein
MSLAQEPAPDPNPGGDKPPNGNGNGNGDDGGWPAVPIRLFKEHWRLLAGIFLLIVLAVLALAAFLPFPEVGAPTDGEPPAIEPTNALVGAYLVRWGIVLVIVAFIGQLFMLIASTIKLEEEQGLVESTGASPADPLAALAGALPGLIKVPAGIGVSLALIGAVLLLGTAVAVQDEGSPTPSPSAASEPRGSTVPVPEPSG